MGLMDTLLQQVTGALGAGSDEHLQNAPAGALGQSITAMFHSDQTPPFANMVGQLFGQSNDEQRAGMLNQLLATAGPALLSQLGTSLPAGTTQLTPEQASQLSASDVQAMAAQAEQSNPGVVESIGHFYAQHPTLIKTLGSAALAIALAKLGEHQQA